MTESHVYGVFYTDALYKLWFDPLFISRLLIKRIRRWTIYQHRGLNFQLDLLEENQIDPHFPTARATRWLKL